MDCRGEQRCFRGTDGLVRVLLPVEPELMHLLPDIPYPLGYQ